CHPDPDGVGRGTYKSGATATFFLDVLIKPICHPDPDGVGRGTYKSGATATSFLDPGSSPG
ncbi:MAG TPA: hypothetical protein VJB15_05220, partial [Rhodothermia bacterium]|nr:hypothetical protein [Rhodothermia bacterium]